MMKHTILSFGLLAMMLAAPWLSWAGPRNVAPLARVTASSEAADCPARQAVDKRIRLQDQGEWASQSTMTFWGQMDYPWLRLEWEDSLWVDHVVLYDRPTLDSHTAGGILHFSDGSRELVTEIPNDGRPRSIRFAPRRIKWLRFEVTDSDGERLGLSEIEVYRCGASIQEPLEWADPYIETARGRYFYFVTGATPYGMIGAAPLTRNKNQYGGGYNYNSTQVLGFPQLHGWMLSGLNLMPTTGHDALPTRGEKGWQSPFTHEGEEVEPGYHRLYLERYDTWVEQTATDRASLYRMTYARQAEAQLLLNLGGFCGTTTMTNAHVWRAGDSEVEGYFDTTGRLWGGPETTRIYFVAQLSRPMQRMDGWRAGAMSQGIDSWQGDTVVIRREPQGMTYWDAPTAGVSLNLGRMEAGQQVGIKMAVSYVDIAGARRNLTHDIPDFDFDGVRRRTQAEWNAWMDRIHVEGGTAQQRTKFYTDLWHVLLGRHKIDDVDGRYPDYTQGHHREGNHLMGARLRVRQLAMRDGRPRYHMYNSDGLWLWQWNLNTLWGLAYPEVLDDFAASMLQYDQNGGLLPRGPNLGGYSYIMSGCPATSLITSAYQRGLLRKWDARQAYRAMRRNHMPGGMMGMGAEEGLKYYIQHGYCPERAGLTIQWTFEDWALGQMARQLGKERDADYFQRRATRWGAMLHPRLRLLLPLKADGAWLHENPLDGWGYEEANAWQSTFGLSHDLEALAQAMGGRDTLCAMLDSAFRQSVGADFVAGYGGGYVSYANQPGLSGAHVFAAMGQPRLTQYWVRRVAEQAYGPANPLQGYGGHDEDQGQMGAMSALMAMGLFSLNGGSSIHPTYMITSPVFDEVVIRLSNDYHHGRQFRIVAHNNSPRNCYIQRATLNGRELKQLEITHEEFSRGGELELWMSSEF